MAEHKQKRRSYEEQFDEFITRLQEMRKQLNGGRQDTPDQAPTPPGKASDAPDRPAAPSAPGGRAPAAKDARKPAGGKVRDPDAIARDKMRIDSRERQLDREHELEKMREAAALKYEYDGGGPSFSETWAQGTLYPNGKGDFKFRSSHRGNRGRGGGMSGARGGRGFISGGSAAGGYISGTFQRADVDGGLRMPNPTAIPDWRPVDTWEPDENGRPRDFTADDFRRHSDRRRSGRFQGGYLDPGFHDAFITAKLGGLNPGDSLYDRTRASAEAEYQRAMTRYSDEWQKYGQSLMNDQAARAARDNPGQAPLRQKEDPEARQMREADEMMRNDAAAALREMAADSVRPERISAARVLSRVEAAEAAQADEGGGTTKKPQVGPTVEAAAEIDGAANRSFGAGGNAASTIMGAGVTPNAVGPAQTSAGPGAPQVVSGPVTDGTKKADPAQAAVDLYTDMKTGKIPGTTATDRTVEALQPVKPADVGPTIENAKKLPKTKPAAPKQNIDAVTALTAGQSENPQYGARVTAHRAVQNSKGQWGGNVTMTWNNETDRKAAKAGGTKPLYMFDTYAATYGKKEAARRFFGGKIPTAEEIQASADAEMGRRRQVRNRTYKRPEAAQPNEQPKEQQKEPPKEQPRPQPKEQFRPQTKEQQAQSSIRDAMALEQKLNDPSRKSTPGELGPSVASAVKGAFGRAASATKGQLGRVVDALSDMVMPPENGKNPTQPLTRQEREGATALGTERINKMKAAGKSSKEIERKRRQEVGRKANARLQSVRQAARNSYPIRTGGLW